MWRRLSLQKRIMILVTAVTVLTVGGGAVSLIYSLRMNEYLQMILDKNLAGLQAADRLETTLVMQKGYLTYFFLDKEPKWLEDLDKYEKEFQDWLIRAEETAETSEDRSITRRIGADYQLLIKHRQEAIALYTIGETKAGYKVHQAARKEFFEIHDLARQFRTNNEQRIKEARVEVSRSARLVSRLALGAIPLAAILGAALAIVLLRQVLRPIRRMAVEAGPGDPSGVRLNEVAALSLGVQSLKKDVDFTRSELETSRLRLIHAEKMASVGKLAASVAHSIRNPLTSVKMRLFSLERALVLSEGEREDFTVIAEEIRHIDNVLRNFLEYSRRPKLKVQHVSASMIVDQALELIQPRLTSTAVKLEIIRPERLPEVNADPDQLKESVINLVVNAAEAMNQGGCITIEEGTLSTSPLGPAVFIKIKDTGPGIPAAIQDSVFQLFFSTKDEGTGLGLAIASRIIEEHGGTLDLESKEGEGAVFTITLPA